MHSSLRAIVVSLLGLALERAAWADPVIEVPNLEWCAGTTSCLEWEPVPGAAEYHLYRGEVPSMSCLRNPANDSCLHAATTGATSASCPENPASGHLFWFIVTESNSGLEGPAGNGSAGPRIRNGTASCSASCAPAGAACASSIDCCTGNCLSGTCRADCCQPSAAACTTGGQCCSGSCTNGVCATQCAGAGDPCASSSECCSGTCTNGACQMSCLAEGEWCVSSAQCCAGSCINAACTNPSDPSRIGAWSAVIGWPLVAIHTVLLRTGEVLLWDGHTEQQGTYLWSPASGSFTFFPPTAVNLFCSSHAALADGRILVGGGTGEFNGIGLRDTKIFTPVANLTTSGAQMAHPRYYPTTITLGDGRILALSGTDTCDTTCIVDTPEVYDPTTNSWTSLQSATQSIPYYPRTFLLPDGRVFSCGASEASTVSRTLDIGTQTWSTVDARILYGGTSAMYRPGKILMGGLAASPSATTASVANAYVIDMTQPSPSWRDVAPMAQPRTHHNFTLLPDGNVLVTGGSRNADSGNTSQAVYEAELWSPTSEAWTTLARMQTPRQYHSTALLLPDGRVLVAGGGRHGVDELSAEIYTPPYLFKGPRPEISAAPATLRLGTTITVETSDAAAIGSVALLRLGSVTHGFNFDQRYVPLSFGQTNGGLNVQVPSSSNVVPPGYYMLFLVTSAGVPSVSRILRVPAPSSDVTPPGAPGSLIATETSGDVALTWGASTDDVGVVGYNVHRSTTQGFAPSSANRIAGTTNTTYHDASFAVGGTYFYVLTAEDAAGNTSLPSNEASATIATDIQAPSVPGGLEARANSPAQVDLAWLASTDDVGVAGYNVFRDGLHVATVVNPGHLDSGLLGGTTYSYSVSAFDAAGNASDPSTPPVEVTTPTSNTGLVAAYDFNESTGTTVSDVSGNSSDGVLVNGPTWTYGKYGSALAFDGSNDYVELGSVLDNLVLPFTVEAWVYPQGTNSGELTILSSDDGPVYAGIVFFLEGSNLRVGLNLGDGGGTGSAHRRTKHGATSLLQNTWTHVAIVVRSSTDMTVFVNGATDGGTYSGSGGPLVHTASPARIGKFRTSFFVGRIDELRVYGRALSQAEIQQDMNSPL